MNDEFNEWWIKWMINLMNDKFNESLKCGWGLRYEVIINPNKIVFETR